MARHRRAITGKYCRDRDGLWVGRSMLYDAVLY
jgi:hypothetical protein